MASIAFDHPALNTHMTPSASPIAVALVSAGETLAKWETRARTRAALKRLDVKLYQDIGLTAAEVLIETAKPFWRA